MRTLQVGALEAVGAGRKSCDGAGEVAYTGDTPGITVTDRGGYERASGARGTPCDGFP